MNNADSKTIGKFLHHIASQCQGQDKKEVLLKKEKKGSVKTKVLLEPIPEKEEKELKSEEAKTPSLPETTITKLEAKSCENPSQSSYSRRHHIHPNNPVRRRLEYGYSEELDQAETSKPKMPEKTYIRVDVEAAKSKQECEKEVDLEAVDKLMTTPLEKQDTDPKPLLQYLEQMAYLTRGFSKSLPIAQPVDYKDLSKHAHYFLPQVSEFVHLFQDLFIQMDIDKIFTIAESSCESRIRRHEDLAPATLSTWVTMKQEAVVVLAQCIRRIAKIFGTKYPKEPLMNMLLLILVEQKMDEEFYTKLVKNPHASYQTCLMKVLETMDQARSGLLRSHLTPGHQRNHHTPIIKGQVQNPANDNEDVTIIIQSLQPEEKGDLSSPVCKQPDSVNCLTTQAETEETWEVQANPLPEKEGPKQQPATVDSPPLDSCLFCSIQGLKGCHCTGLSSITTKSEESSLSVNGDSDNEGEPVMDTEDFNDHCCQLAARMLLKSALGPEESKEGPNSISASTLNFRICQSVNTSLLKQTGIQILVCERTSLK
jgi:hypothetical protein